MLKQIKPEESSVVIDRLEKQIRFIIEIDKLKQVGRQTYLTDASRHENSVEHSWHLAVMAMILSEHANDTDIDLFRVIKMVLVQEGAVLLWDYISELIDDAVAEGYLSE